MAINQGNDNGGEGGGGGGVTGVFSRIGKGVGPWVAIGIAILVVGGAVVFFFVK